jgi:hypothetical protein
MLCVFHSEIYMEMFNLINLIMSFELELFSLLGHAELFCAGKQDFL